MKKKHLSHIPLSVYPIATTAWVANDSWQDSHRDYLNKATAESS